MKMSFRSRMISITVFACLICAAASVWVANRSVTSLGEEDLVNKSRAILSRLEAVREYVATQGGLQPIVDRMVQEYPDGNLPSEAKAEVLKQVPIFASMKIGSANSEKENYEFRVFSDEPRNQKNQASDHEMSIFNRFKNDPNLQEWTEEKDGKLIVYRPVLLSEKQGCLTCHGNPSTSPWKNGKDILGFPMENWSDGKLHGVFAVISDLKPVQAAAMASTGTISMWSFLGAVLSVALALFLLKGPLSSLSAVSEALKVSGSSLSSASNEIASSSQSLSSASSQAAASLEETTASTEEMASMILLSAKNAEEAKKLSVECEAKAQQGKAEVSRLIEAMGEISKSSGKIEEIIAVIDDIAFQTNLLALNAAVEAARAGEQGKGFAVVAEAVQSLAQRSASSAKEISDLIKDSVERINNGSTIAERSGVSLSEIVTAVSKMSQLNAEISNASSEQSQGVQSINRAINELDKVTQQNAAASEQTAASSEQLRDQSRQLHEYVESLIGVLHGDQNKAA
jgi:methyl-accepting chemotaxis protein